MANVAEGLSRKLTQTSIFFQSSFSQNNDRLYYHKMMTMYLLNPSLRELKMVALTCLIETYPGVTLALAYHSQNNDLKLLQILCSKTINHYQLWQICEILLPKNHLDESFLYFERLVVIKKSLALIVFGIGGVLTRESDICHIWVMEYGVVWSWTK